MSGKMDRLSLSIQAQLARVNRFVTQSNLLEFSET